MSLRVTAGGTDWQVFIESCQCERMSESNALTMVYGVYRMSRAGTAQLDGLGREKQQCGQCPINQIPTPLCST